MKYIDLFKYLKSIINFDADVIEIDDEVELRNYDFKSEYKLLPGSDLNNGDSYEYPLSDSGDIEPDIIQELIHKTDAEIEENNTFHYHVVLPKGEGKTNKIILMFHGFNEKYWDKYNPWAYYLAKKTGKAVVMFPIAFHMNRAPAMWSDVRKMYGVSQRRKERYPEVLGSSLSNVAISSRLHVKPQRYIWSGFQAYYDVMAFVKDIKAGNHPLIEATASIDFMSYSIGTFLGEILMITNENNYFSESKYATFCGGAVFNRLTPVSKFILDSEANVALYSYLVEHLESHIKRDELLCKHLTETTVGRNFAMMLNSNTHTEEREALFREKSHQFYGILLKQDKIIPYYEVMNTMQGVCRDIPIRLDLIDFPYTYIHEDPFPALTKIEDEVDAQFKDVFDRISEFLK